MSGKFNLRRIGIILLVIGIVFFVSENIYEIKGLAFIHNYGKFIFMMGAAFWAMGYFKKDKGQKL